MRRAPSPTARVMSDIAYLALLTALCQGSRSPSSAANGAKQPGSLGLDPHAESQNLLLPQLRMRACHWSAGSGSSSSVFLILANRARWRASLGCHENSPLSGFPYAASALGSRVT